MRKKRKEEAMDGYEATRIVLSRIQSLDPDNASKIMGLLLLQDHGEKEMIRLAFGPETLVHSVIVKAKKELGLMRPSWSQEELISPKNNRGSSLNPASLPFYANGGRSSRDFTNDLEFMDDVNPRADFLGFVHARSGSCVLDGLGYGDTDLGFGGVPCSYFARGFCKNGSSCRFVHSDGGGGAEFVGSPSRIELLRSNSVPPRLAHHFMTRSSLPSFSPKGVSLQQSDVQRFDLFPNCFLLVIYLYYRVCVFFFFFCLTCVNFWAELLL